MGQRGEQRPVPGDKSDEREREERDKRERKIKKEKGDRQGLLFIREYREYAGGVPLVIAAEDISCQDPKGGPVQMPEY